MRSGWGIIIGAMRFGLEVVYKIRSNNMNLEIAGHVAVVTGGARGIGAGICKALADEDCTIVVWDRDDEAQRMADDLVKIGRRATAVVADVTDPVSVRRAVAQITERHPSIEVLVNCAGFSKDAPITEMTDGHWHEVIGINLHAPFYVCREIIPMMMKAGYGRIINMSSRAQYGDSFKSNYSAAKAGLVGLTGALALELGKYGITVNAVAPGLIETERARGTPYYAEVKQRSLDRTPTARLGNERDVADAVLYLAGRRSGYVTGELLHVAGGRLR